MAIQDPIADMLTRVRNGQMAKHYEVSMPNSKQKVALAQLLKQEGYIENYVVHGEGAKTVMVINLKYFDGKAVISRVKRVSKPSLRRYCGVKDLPKIKGGLGIAVVSTSKGLMTDVTARAQGLGGEILCVVE
jgi:small subunit ribosomal protein S8